MCARIPKGKFSEVTNIVCLCDRLLTYTVVFCGSVDECKGMEGCCHGGSYVLCAGRFMGII